MTLPHCGRVYPASQRVPPCAIRDIIAAVAVGAVVIAGDKEDLARTAMLNEGHAVDVAELGADEETGADVLYELKSSASRRSARSTALARARRRSACCFHLERLARYSMYGLGVLEGLVSYRNRAGRAV